MQISAHLLSNWLEKTDCRHLLVRLIGATYWRNLSVEKLQRETVSVELVCLTATSATL